MTSLPFILIPDILQQCMQIAQTIGTLTAYTHLQKPAIKLIKDKQIMTIHGSLAIEVYQKFYCPVNKAPPEA